MHPDFYQLIEMGAGILTLLGLGLGVKLLVWDLPTRRFRRLEQRITELEERQLHVLDAVMQHDERLEDYDDRLDFGERLLARKRGETPRPA